MTTTVTPDQITDAMPHSLPGERVAWVLHQALAIASGAETPSRVEIEVHYAPAWLGEVPVAAVLTELASVLAAVTHVELEACRRTDEVTTLLHVSDNGAVRLRCVVEDQPPHRIRFQLLSPAMVPVAYVDRVVARDGRSVHVRDFGGDGPLLMLWHGAGCDVSIWEAMVPYLRSFRVVAQDLPAHGASLLARMSVSDAVADTRALLHELGLDEPILVGHSLGGWAALHFAATVSCRALVCLDGPTTLDFGAMGLQPSDPAFLPDPPDVRADLASLGCPAMIVLCQGASPGEEEWMVPFRTPLSDHLAREHPEIRVAWRPTDHMIVLSQAVQTANLITRFTLDDANVA